MSAQQNQGFKYPQCKKGGYHVGEILNLVCIQPKCIQKCIICGLCYDEDHKSHKIKPLKMVIHNSKNYLEKLKPLQVDNSKIKQMMTSNKNKMITSFQQFQKYIQTTITSIKESINAVYFKMFQQLELKSGNSQQLLTALNQLKVQQIEQQKFINLMQKLLAGVPMNPDQEQTQMSGKQIQESLKGIQIKLQKDLQSVQNKIKKQIDSYSKKIKIIADNPPLFDPKIQFKFSQQLHHGGVQVVTDTIIKSTQAYNYHFALMEPSVQQKGNKPVSVSFKIRQNHSNWLAVGLCHKNVVQSNNYQFNYSTLGHGAYMISANAGSWSSIDSSKNNVVTSFNFYKDDVIIVNYNPSEGNIVFKKKGTEESHTIEFENKDDDQLYLCGLFYYNNDEIEYMGYDSETS